jgi:hypothetical protein
MPVGIFVTPNGNLKNLSGSIAAEKKSGKPRALRGCRRLPCLR